LAEDEINCILEEGKKMKRGMVFLDRSLVIHSGYEALNA
jgi:hypothetical protein